MAKSTLVHASTTKSKGKGKSKRGVKFDVNAGEKTVGTVELNSETGRYEWSAKRQSGTSATLRGAKSAVARVASTKKNPLRASTGRSGHSVTTHKVSGGKVKGEWEVFSLDRSEEKRPTPGAKTKKVVQSKGRKLGTVTRQSVGKTAGGNHVFRYFPSKGNHPKGFKTLMAAAKALA